MRHGLLVDDIHGRGLLDDPERNGTPLVLLRSTKGREDGCFGAVFMDIHKGQGSCGGSISAETYRQHTVPVIHGYIEFQRREGIHLRLMQDGAPGHSAADTKQELQERGIEVISWPPFSPDLNPICCYGRKQKVREGSSVCVFDR
jgi:hypothetical protein